MDTHESKAVTSHTANQGSKFSCSGAFSVKGHFMPRQGGMVRNSEWEKLGKKGQEEVGGRRARPSQAPCLGPPGS